MIDLLFCALLCITVCLFFVILRLNRQWKEMMSFSARVADDVNRLEQMINSHSMRLLKSEKDMVDFIMSATGHYERIGELDHDASELLQRMEAMERRTGMEGN